MMVYGLLVWYTMYRNKYSARGCKGRGQLVKCRVKINKYVYSMMSFSQSSADMNCHIRAKTARRPSLTFIDQVELV